MLTFAAPAIGSESVYTLRKQGKEALQAKDGQHVGKDDLVQAGGAGRWRRRQGTAYSTSRESAVKLTMVALRQL